MSVYDENTGEVLSIDYTSRDYFALRADMIERVKERLSTEEQQWTGEDPNDFAVALIEAFAYMGDIVNYYIDRIANESFLPTASQRENIINLAKQFGYIPTGYRAATCEVEFTNSSASDITLPVGTQVAGEITVDGAIEELIFSTESEIVVPAAVGDVAGTETVRVRHYESIASRDENLSTGPGDVAGEFLGTSNGQPNQRFTLLENQVVDDSVIVYVENGNVYEPWIRVVHLTDYGPEDNVFTVEIDADNQVSVVFGDGVSGAVPVIFAGIKADYGVGGGVLGNIGTNVLTELYRVPGTTDSGFLDIQDVVTVINSNTTTGIGRGGVDPESNESIKANAPESLTALNRAVSLQDYERLAFLVGNVGKARAEAENSKLVNLYVAPQRDGNDAFPGYDPTGSTLLDEWTTLQDEVVTFLSDKTMVGTTLAVLPPNYVLVNLSVVYTRDPKYDQTTIETAIKNKIFSVYSYQNLNFGDLISPEIVESDLLDIEGITKVNVTSIERDDGKTNGTVNIQADDDEIFVFIEAGLTLAEASGDADLSDLSGPAGTTLQPAFQPDFFVYNLNGVTTDSILVTPTTNDIGASATVSGQLPTVPASTPNGELTTIPIVVTAADGVSTNAYVLIVDRT